MKIHYNVTGADRKALVKVIADTAGARAVYKGMPSAAYEIDYYTVTKDGTLEFSDRSDSEEVEAVLEALAVPLAPLLPPQAARERTMAPDRSRTISCFMGSTSFVLRPLGGNASPLLPIQWKKTGGFLPGRQKKFPPKGQKGGEPLAARDSPPEGTCRRRAARG